MTSTTPTLTYFATVQNQNGTERRIAITLPHIACIADLPRYTAPPPLPEPPLTEIREAAAMVGKTHPPHARPRPQAHRAAAQPDRLRGDDAPD